MPEYINPNIYTVHLTGPDGKVIKMKSRQKMVLSDFFDRYRTRGFIRLVSEEASQPVTQRIQSKINLSSRKPNNTINSQLPIKSLGRTQEQSLLDQKKRRVEIAKARKIVRSKPQPVNKRIYNQSNNQIVGRTININPTELLKSNLAKYNYPISNNIGIGILSYNRKESLERLIDSIINFTDLRRTTVFISDDCSTDPNLISYLDELSKNNNFVVIRNDKRLGVSGNTNRLLRCLSRFAYGLLLNDDVEILNYGWDNFYVDALVKTNMHHFVYRQSGVYGAKIGEPITVGECELLKVTDKPHGAILAFTNHMLDKCGYFDESYGIYGMEHVDWSQKAWEFGLQIEGFFDVKNSDSYFLLHSDKSAVENREELLQNSRKIFKSRTVKKIHLSDTSIVPAISYVIPFRDIGRTDAIKTVVNNIRGQKFPVINIFLVEQDSSTHVNLQDFHPINYFLAAENTNPLFNKSKAFNLAVSKVTDDRVILHDADIMVQSNYTSTVYDILDKYTACHIGNSVVYADTNSTNIINNTYVVNYNVKCDRVVGYFEGGSLACHVSEYWKCGAFNEDFWGYGCEDCDFYARLAANSIWCENRTFDFLHLWHGRVAGWNSHHDTNRRIEASLVARSMNDRVQLQYSQLNRLGYGEFVSKSLKHQ